MGQTTKSIKFQTLLLLLLGVLLQLPVWAQISWEQHPVPMEETLKNNVKFGYFTVPENRENPNSRKIRIAFAVIKSDAEQPLPDPVAMIPGGPGVGTTQYAPNVHRFPPIQKVLEKRDLILVDPRASGFSEPAICENLNAPKFQFARYFLSGKERDAILKEAIQQCADEIAQNGIDISSYSAVSVAHDFDALRKALGYEQWNLLGASYGTRYGMTFMQLYPESVRSAMFFGLRMKNTFYDRVPAGLAASLQKVFDECAADPNCQNAYPDLEADFYRLLDRIKEQPVEIEKFITEKFSESTHYYTQEMVLSTLFYMLYQKQGIEMIPAVIQQLANGNDWILQNLTAPSIKRMSGTKTDASLIISCVDDEPRPDYLSPYGNTSLAVKIRETFDGFPDDRIRYFFPVLSGERHFPEEQWQQLDIPTLLFSGALDPTTPPTNADSLLSNLSNARHYVIPGSGHTPQMDAALDFTAFIDDPKPEKDISTAMNIKPLQFVHQIVLNRGLAETFTKIQTGNYKPVFLPALALLLCVFGLLYFPIRFVIQKLRKKPAKEKIGLLLPVWLVAAVPLVLSFLLVKVVGETMASNPFLLSMGFAGESNFLEPGAVVLLIALLWSGWKVYKNPTLKIKTPVVISLAGGFLFLIFLPLMNFI